MLGVRLSWSEEPKDVSVGVGKDIFILCNARGHPKPIIEWLKVSDGEEKPNIFGSQLRFHSISQTDSGSYQCIARNGIDKDLSKIIKLQVLGK